VAAPAAVVIAFLAWPMLFTSSGMGQDWSSHLWEMWRQSLTIAHEGHPSLFLSFSEAVLYPLYAFYGGTVYALTGCLAVLLGGSPIPAYVATWIFCFAAAYGGWYWLGRMAGLGRWAAQVPGLLYITSGYYLTLVYARGDWLEFVGVSAVPMLAASALSVLRAGRLRLLPALALAGSTLVFFGSHNIVILWGSTWLVLLAAALALAVPDARRTVTRAGVVRVLLVAVPAALANAWYLLPDLAYASRTSIASVYPYARELRASAHLLAAGNLLTPFRTYEYRGDPDFVYALPVFTIAAVIVGIAISFRHPGERAWRRVLWTLSGSVVLVIVVMTHPGLILDLPRPYTLVQFGFRLESFVLLGLSGAVLTVLVLTRSWPRRSRMACYVVAAIALAAAGAAAVIQVDGYPQGTEHPPHAMVADRYVVIASDEIPPPTAAVLTCFNGVGCGFNDHTLPRVGSSPPELVFPSSAVRNDRAAVRVPRLLVGTLVPTNLAGAPYFVDVKGALVMGRDSADHMVLLILPPKKGHGPWVSLSPAERLPVVLGRVITLVALGFLALGAVLGLARKVGVSLARLRAPTAHVEQR
jgi:hypothetical protein